MNSYYTDLYMQPAPAFQSLPPTEFFPYTNEVKLQHPPFPNPFYASPQSSTCSFSPSDTKPIQIPDHSNESLTEDSEDEKKSKQKSLERNRLAGKKWIAQNIHLKPTCCFIAYKCRQRKKEWVDELAKKTERLTRENTYLKNLIFQLKEEALFIKTQLLLHKQ